MNFNLMRSATRCEKEREGTKGILAESQYSWNTLVLTSYS